MKPGIATGILFIALGLVLAIGPWSLFPACEPAANASGHIMPMRCWWTARIEIGLGLAAVFGGILTLICRSACFRAGVAAMVLAVAAVAAAAPLGLIGVCGSPEMICRLAMLPALVIAAAFLAVTALVAWIRSGGGSE